MVHSKKAMFGARRSILLLVALAITGSACGSSGPKSATPAASAGDSSITISALDTLKFDPPTVSVKAGVPVTFTVRNPGTTTHEFVLGPESVQKIHEEAAASTSMHHGMSAENQLAALKLKPGASETVTVTFEAAGSIIYGCHVAGHYDAGMRGTVSVGS